MAGNRPLSNYASVPAKYNLKSRLLLRCARNYSKYIAQISSSLDFRFLFGGTEAQFKHGVLPKNFDSSLGNPILLKLLKSRCFIFRLLLWQCFLLINPNDFWKYSEVTTDLLWYRQAICAAPSHFVLEPSSLVRAIPHISHVSVFFLFCPLLVW